MQSLSREEAHVSTPTDPEERVSWVYSSSSSSEVEARYDAWAEDYDSDLTDTFDYVLPERCAAEFAQFVDVQARVLDVGAGTGLVGTQLRRHGFTEITGIDISAEMLRRAEQTGAYRELHKAELGLPLPFGDDVFDAAICVGVFTDGHAPASAVPEIVRVVRSGGIVLIPIRPDILDSHGFRDMFDSLVLEGAWTELSVSEPYPPMPKGEPDVMSQTRVWRLV